VSLLEHGWRRCNRFSRIRSK